MKEKTKDDRSRRAGAVGHPTTTTTSKSRNANGGDAAELEDLERCETTFDIMDIVRERANNNTTTTSQFSKVPPSPGKLPRKHHDKADTIGERGKEMQQKQQRSEEIGDNLMEEKSEDSLNILSVVQKRIIMHGQQESEEGETTKPSYLSYLDDTTTTTPNQSAATQQHSQPRQPPQPSLPGAYTEAPGTTTKRRNKIHFSIFGRTGYHHQRAAVDPTTPSSVEKDSVTAENMKLGQQKKDGSENENSTTARRKIYICGFVLFACLVLAVSLAIGLTTTNQKKKNTSSVSVANNETQDSGGLSGNNIDGKEPQQILQEQLELVFGDANPMEEFPPETIAAILQSGNDAAHGTPQLMALEWLSNDPKLNQYGIPQKRQRLALASLYFSTNGPKWFAINNDDMSNHSVGVTNLSNHPVVTNPWLDYELHECEWFSLSKTIYGIEPCYNYTILNDHHRHHHVDFKSLVLIGSSSIQKTTILYYPTLRGTLPPQIGLLTKLELLDLGYQKLKGTIPTHINDVLVPRGGSGGGTLKKVILEENYFTGTIPDSFFEYATVIRLNRNPRLERGAIPTVIGINKGLSHLELIGTNRVGTIPRELFRVSTLQQILLSDNRLTGTIPSDIGRLSNTLQRFDVEVNRLGGPLPSQVGLLHRLVYLLVGGNRFNGTLSSDMMTKLTSLQEMELYNNQLHGSIPSQIGTVTKLTYLNLGQNRFTGILPTSLSQLSQLRYLNLYDNHINGTLRPELLVSHNNSKNETATQWTVESAAATAWPFLQTLDLANNRMEGSLPSQLGLLRPLQHLKLRYNNFVSKIPKEFENLDSLQAILLEATDISGTMPEKMCFPTPIETLRVDCKQVECPVSCECICV